ncbi:MAG: hypothetical protein NZZ60_00640 [Bacteroidia bacterium]|nr:hypothetical protein [Bacteroidia bacterium]
MPRARLLHSPEDVEVLQIDKAAQIAIVRRHGFQQSVSLKDLIIDEEANEPSILNLQGPSHDQIKESGTEIELYSRLSEKKAELYIAHWLSTPCFYGLYIRKNDKSWLPIYADTLTPGQVAVVHVDMEAIAPPWEIFLQRLEIPQQAVMQLPVVSTMEIPIKLSMLTKAGKQRIFPTPTSHSISAPLPASEREGIRIPTPAHEIDLHIETLAPHMQGCSADAIFSYQVSFMKRFLYACEAARLPFTIVIHGVGKKKLQSTLLKFCQEQGWHTEPLLTPPYMGGATKVKFSS